MQHLTRKVFFEAVYITCTLIFVMALEASIPAVAWGEPIASNNIFNQGGLIGGPDDEGDEENKPTPSLPYAEIKKVTPGENSATLRAYLYLPYLPIDPLSDEDEQPPLQTLTIERAYERDATTWDTIGVLTWNFEHYTYESEDQLLSVVNIFPNDNPFTLVQYLPVVHDYRDFYLRVTAVSLVQGTPTTITIDPALFTYPEGMRPTMTPDTPPTSKPSTDTNGDIDGNRGNVVPGISERIDPQSNPWDLLPSAEKAEAVPSNSGSRIVEAPNTDPNDPTSLNGSGTNLNAPTREGAEAGVMLISNEETADRDEAGPAAEQNSFPGFAWAIGASAFIIVGVGIVFTYRLQRAKQRRP